MAFGGGNTSTLQGIAFPFSVSPFSVPATNEGLSTVVDAVKSLLFTGLGEIPMEPGTGTNLHSFVFQSLNSLTEAQIASEVRRVINENEPRMEDLSVTATASDVVGNRSGLVVHIEYALSDLRS